MLNDVYDDTRTRMEKSISHLTKDLSAIRTGRASVGLVEDIKITYYGTPTPLNQVASLSVPESRMIVIQPWDKGVLKEIERAITNSGLGLTPTSDGNVVRIVFPPLTQERRKELTKLVKKMGEDCKVAIRNIRRDANAQIKELEKEKMISEDDAKKGTKEVQQITDEFIGKVDRIIEEKEKEILEF